MNTKFYLGLIGLVTILTACGQPGPLYLPTDKPPVYVPPEEQTKQESDTKPELNKETKPQTENNQQLQQ